MSRFVHPGRALESSFRVFCLAALLNVSAFGSALATELILIRSGNDANGPLAEGAVWAQAHQVHAGESQVSLRSSFFGTDLPFTSLDYFDLASFGSSPYVVAPVSMWLSSLPNDPQARWINGTRGSPVATGFPPRSTLYCIPFTVQSASVGSARLYFTWAADDRLGDYTTTPNESGVYLNKVPVSPIIHIGGFTHATSEQRDITALIHPGVNQLYIYQRDMKDVVSGVIFSAAIEICPAGGPSTIVVTSGAGVGAGAVAAEQCLAGASSTPLSAAVFGPEFAMCNTPTRICAGPWTLPTGLNAADRFVNPTVNGSNFGSPPVSALYRSQFFVPLSTSANATMTFNWAADDRLGDPTGPNTNAVYLNGTGVTPAITGGGFNASSSATRSVALNPGQWNNLYVYGRDAASGFSGVAFDATFNVTDSQLCFFWDPWPFLLYANWLDATHLRVRFSRAVTRVSAENAANYSLGSFATVADARLDLDGRGVILTTFGGASSGSLDNVSVAGVVAADTAAVMIGSQTTSGYVGVQGVGALQAPDPSALSGFPCADRSSFAGSGDVPGPSVTFRGVCAAIGSYGASIMDSTGGPRSGVLVADADGLVPGHVYRISGHVQELAGETGLAGVENIVEERSGSLPAATLSTISVLRKTTCDASQSLLTGEDYEGMLVSIAQGQVVYGFSRGHFVIRDPNGTPADTIDCVMDSTFAFQPAPGQILGVKGILLYRNGAFRIAPGTDADITVIQSGPVTVSSVGTGGLVFLIVTLGALGAYAMRRREALG